MDRPESLSFGMFWCCEHCGCPAGYQHGHADTCAEGCNDDEMEY